MNADTYATINIPLSMKQKFQIARINRGFKTDKAAAIEALTEWMKSAPKSKPIKSRDN